jgi:hypothetical protein
VLLLVVEVVEHIMPTVVALELLLPLDHMHQHNLDMVQISNTSTVVVEQVLDLVDLCKSTVEVDKGMNIMVVVETVDLIWELYLILE